MATRCFSPSVRRWAYGADCSVFHSLPTKRACAWLAQRQIKADNLTQLTVFRHTFSHFHLDIVPMWFTVHSSGACMDEGNALWYNLSAAAVGRSGGPVERLLQQLKAGTPV